MFNGFRTKDYGCSGRDWYKKRREKKSLRVGYLTLWRGDILYLYGKSALQYQKLNIMKEEIRVRVPWKDYYLFPHCHL